MVAQFDRLLSENSRIYMELGSVWVKTLARQTPQFLVLSYHPADRRVRAKPCRLVPAGKRPTLRIHTDRGPFDVGEQQFARLADGSTAPVAELPTGARLHSQALLNREGTISVETIYREIWLHELIEADSQGYPINLAAPPVPPAAPYVTVKSVDAVGEAPCFAAQVECVTRDEVGSESGHNLMLWPDGTSFGRGIFVF